MTDKKPYKCDRCGEVNPAEIHTCTPIDPLLEALRVPENKREWKGLTDEEVVERSNKEVFAEAFARGVAWAEVTLKEKNT